MNFIPKIEFGVGPTIIENDLPPKGDPRGEQVKSIGRTKTAKSGLRQRVTDFIEQDFEVTWSFVTKAKRDELETFFNTHALLGNEFEYFFDKDDAGSVVTVEFDDNALRRIQWNIMFRSGVEFKYEVKMGFRRVIG